MSVSLGKRSYWCIYDSQTLSFVGAKSSGLVIVLHDVFISDMSSYSIFIVHISVFAVCTLLFLCGGEVVIRQCLLKVRLLTSD